MVDDAKDPAPDVMTFAEFCAFATTYPLQSLMTPLSLLSIEEAKSRSGADFATKC